MHRKVVARCRSWTRFVFVLALFLLTASAALAQGQAKPQAKPTPAPAAQGTPTKTSTTPAAADATPPASTASSATPSVAPDADLPSEPPASAALPPGEAELARGLPIQRIQVTGNRRVTPEDVLTYIRERVGQTFKPETLTQDVRELWNSGFFDDIEVDLDRHDEGVELRFVVRERPSIATITFEGNDEISKDDLNEGIELKPNTILSLPAVRRTVQKIRDMYAEKGYFLAEVQQEVIPQKNNEVEVKFKITE
ncbi:MAG TPA: POTRA domain-containing protein, partial [Polyangiaceae bacterium]